MDRGQHGRIGVVESIFWLVIADLPDRLPGDPGYVYSHLRGHTDLPADQDQAGADEGLAGHPGIGVLGEDGI